MTVSAMQLGALIAGTYASTREVARILQEAGFRTLLQEGARGEDLHGGGRGALAGFAHLRETHGAWVGQGALQPGDHGLAASLDKRDGATKSPPPPEGCGIDIVANDTIDLIFRNETEK